ncbi:hypothetical protein FVE85_2844 [Porphyridium purpureum]|uniref:Uncharacterized protein n=1 Tax=Porphyridium purpureum TaxID=35688 RepID=A0A5J4YV18_PORPP|nr:hypothetical protein FVE85_2844 [Porphyridium purpureum]|eukprot:POR7340..scf227_4
MASYNEVRPKRIEDTASKRYTPSPKFDDNQEGNECHACIPQSPACPPLTLNRKLKRLAWARQFQLEQTNSAPIVFSDEKKFNLDKPDDFHKTWLERAADAPDV